MNLETQGLDIRDSWLAENYFGNCLQILEDRLSADALIGHNYGLLEPF